MPQKSFLSVKKAEAQDVAVAEVDCGEMLEELKTDFKVAVDDYIILKEAHQLQ